MMEWMRGRSGPVAGTDLARHFQVSRQCVVQDVAILRAERNDILSTPRGYRLPAKPARDTHRAVIACQHAPERTEEELQIFVDNGVHVLDVIVEHSLYGEMRGSLMIESRADVQDFVARWRSTTGQPAFVTDARRAFAHGGGEQAGDDRASQGAIARSRIVAEMTQQTTQTARTPRRAQLRRAFFRGESLRLENPAYLSAVRAFLDELVDSDLGGGDLTVAALGLVDEVTGAKILAKEPGVVAGVSNCAG